MSDTLYFWTIITFFIALGAALPFIETEFTGTVTSINTSQFSDQLGQDVSSANAVNIGDVAKSIFLMFFWTFGLIPWWLDALLFLPMRIVLLWLLASRLWGVGG